MADPITVAAIENDPQYVYEDADGTTFEHYDLTFPPEAWARIQQGRACLRCWEQQEIAFFLATTSQSMRTNEKHLPGCPYEGNGIRSHQQADIAAEFYGDKWVGPKKKLEDTIAEDDERRRKYQMDTGIKPGPWVPPWVKL